MTSAQTLPAPSTSSRSSPSHDLDPDVLAVGLEDLRRGPEIQFLLICVGEAAVPALTRFLLGAPGLHPQPRVLAAGALGAIASPRATQALIAAVCRGPIPGLSPILALSEETVRNAAARELGRIGDRSATGPLLYALRRSHLIEAGRALLKFQDRRAVPALVECLEDSFVRERAAGILLEFGADAVESVIAGLVRRELRGGIESPRSIDRRAACGRFLGTVKDRRAVAPLRERLADPAREVRTAAAIALARIAPDVSVVDRIPVLVVGLRDTLMADDCIEALLTRPGTALAPLLGAIYNEAAALGTRGGRIPSRPLRAMVRTLAGAGPLGERALWRLASDSDALLRGLALGHLAKVDAARAAPLVEACLHDPDTRVRSTAAACARLLGLRSRRRLAALRLLEIIGKGVVTGLGRLVHGFGHA